MNLLNKYLPNYSGHLENIEYQKRKGILTIVFYDKPEEFNPILKLIFKGVTHFSSEQIDNHEENCIELAIGFDLKSGWYCLHTGVREIAFKSNNVESIAIKT